MQEHLARAARRRDWAYEDANGRPLMGPCEDARCLYASKPGGGRHDGAHSHEADAAERDVPGFDHASNPY